LVVGLANQERQHPRPFGWLRANDVFHRGN
jgi:hypothetical protein